jgi:hypothetical protein
MHRIKLGYKSVEPQHYAQYRIISTAEYHYGLKVDARRHGLQEAMEHAFDLARRQPEVPVGLALVGAGTEYPKLHGVPSARLSMVFWETLYERVRAAEFNHHPSRLDSFFVAATLADAALFRHRDKVGDVLCRVDISACNVQVHLDHAQLAELDGGWNFTRAWEQVARYWAGELSADPLMEVLCQGEVVFGERCVL